MKTYIYIKTAMARYEGLNFCLVWLSAFLDLTTPPYRP